VGRLGRRLGKLEGMSRAVVDRRSEWDLSLLSDDELEELAGLAGKAEEANRVGAAVDWTADEVAALTRLGNKAHRHGGAAH
jgi:hypothetical protein